MSGGVSSAGLSLLDPMAEKAGGDDEVTTRYDFNVVLKIVFILFYWTHLVAGFVRTVRVLCPFRSQFAPRAFLGRLAPPEHRWHGGRCERCRVACTEASEQVRPRAYRV